MTGRTTTGGRTLLLPLALLAASACRPDPEEPPDPDEPLLPVSCDDEEAPLTLVRTEADSLLGVPPWLQVCALCPPTSIGVVASVVGDDVPLEVSWASDLGCAVAVAAEPLPDADELTVDLDIVDGDRTGQTTMLRPLPGGRGSNPSDLGTATWRIALQPQSLRLPALDLSLLELPGEPRDILLHLGPADAAGERSVTVGVALPDGGGQDPCQPTSSWEVPATLDRRQVGGQLSIGDRLPSWPGGPLRRGAWQATLDASGETLLDGAFLGLLDVNQAEQEWGRPPDAICAAFASASTGSPCQPCDDPAGGSSGLPTCVPMLWEFATAARQPAALVPVEAGDLPEECL